MEKGFTLIELLVTFVILGLIMMIGVQTYQNITINSQQTKYEYYRKIMINGADILLESRKNVMESGECYSILYQDLVKSGKVIEDEITCTGYLQLTKTGKKFHYNDANLECKDKNNTILKEKTEEISASCTKVDIN